MLLRKKVSVIIPNWNGEKLLRKNLPQVLKALPKNSEVIVVDDGSTDGSKEYLKTTTKNLKVIFNDRNLGFSKVCNQAAKSAKGEFLVLLNNDVIPEKGFLKPALNHFNDPDVFAVSFNEPQFGWAKIWWRGGFIHHGTGGRGKKSHICAWASGGSAVFRKSMWRELGGLDKLYEPFYWEDFDLGYRAWRRGWKIIWEPGSIVYHRHESTISKFSRDYVNLIRERNQLLFIWKNIDDFWLRLSHPFGLALRALTAPNYIKVIWSACKQYRRFNKPEEKNRVRADKEILGLFK